MKLADSFIPTAGAVGLLPMITYFFMIVALFAFLGIFLFALASRSTGLPAPASSRYQLMPAGMAVAAAVSGLVYYLMQSYYHDLLAELPAVTDDTDRQTLIRESYNAIGQYRYMAWFITTPLLLLQTVLMLNLDLIKSSRPLLSLLGIGSLLAFAGYVGHQQLSFDTEIIAGSKLGLSPAVAGCYAITFICFRRFDRAFTTLPLTYRLAKRIMLVSLGIYVACYFLTISRIDFNWIHLILTLTDVASQAGVGLLAYLTLSGKQMAD